MVLIDIVTWGSRIGKVDLDISLVALVPGPRGPAAMCAQRGRWVGSVGWAMERVGGFGRLYER